MKPIKYFRALLLLSTLVFFKGMPMLCAAAQGKSKGKIVFCRNYYDKTEKYYINSLVMEGITIQIGKDQKLHLYGKTVSAQKLFDKQGKKKINLNPLNLSDLIEYTQGSSIFTVQKSLDLKEIYDDIRKEFTCKLDIPSQDPSSGPLTNQGAGIKITQKNYFIVRVKNEQGKEEGLLLVPIASIFKEIHKIIEVKRNEGKSSASQSDSEKEYDGEAIDIKVVNQDRTSSMANTIFIGGGLNTPIPINDGENKCYEVKLGATSPLTLKVTPEEVRLLEKFYKKMAVFFAEEKNAFTKGEVLPNIYKEVLDERPSDVTERKPWKENLEKFRDTTVDQIKTFHNLMVELEGLAKSPEHILAKHCIAAVKENLGIKNLADILEIQSRFFPDAQDPPKGKEKNDQKSPFQSATSWYFFGGGAAIGAVLSFVACWFSLRSKGTKGAKKEVPSLGGGLGSQKKGFEV